MRGRGLGTQSGHEAREKGQGWDPGGAMAPSGGRAGSGGEGVQVAVA